MNPQIVAGRPDAGGLGAILDERGRKHARQTNPREPLAPIRTPEGTSRRLSATLACGIPIVTVNRSSPDASTREHMAQVSITVNGKQRTADVESRTLLVHFLREHLNLTGTHVGCDTSQCGACTGLIDGRSAKSCTIFAVQADGSEITTIEGLADGDRLHPLQDGFWEEHGLQCGYCTPGMIMSAVNLLNDNSTPSEQEIREGLDGNFCRCTGYQHIVNAVQHAANKG